MSESIAPQYEFNLVYPTTSVLEVAEQYDLDNQCYPFSGDKLAYYFRNYDSWPVDVYLP